LSRHPISRESASEEMQTLLTLEIGAKRICRPPSLAWKRVVYIIIVWLNDARLFTYSLCSTMKYKMHFQKKKIYQSISDRNRGDKKACSTGLSRHLLWVAVFIHGCEQLNGEYDTTSF